MIKYVICFSQYRKYLILSLIFWFDLSQFFVTLCSFAFSDHWPKIFDPWLCFEKSDPCFKQNYNF